MTNEGLIFIGTSSRKIIFTSEGYSFHDGPYITVEYNNVKNVSDLINNESQVGYLGSYDSTSDVPGLPIGDLINSKWSAQPILFYSDKKGIRIYSSDSAAYQTGRTFIFVFNGGEIISATYLYQSNKWIDVKRTNTPEVTIGINSSNSIPPSAKAVYDYVKSQKFSGSYNDLTDVPTDVIINSSTEGSTKKFKITVDDAGTITAMEVTESTV